MRGQRVGSSIWRKLQLELCAAATTSETGGVAMTQRAIRDFPDHFIPLLTGWAGRRRSIAKAFHFCPCTDWR
jgi:hypothetical protein